MGEFSLYITLYFITFASILFITFRACLSLLIHLSVCLFIC